MNGIIETVSLGNGTAFGNEVIDLILKAGTISKIVLIILLLFSLASWGIILDKWLQFRRTSASAKVFFLNFRKAENLHAMMKRISKSKKIDPVSRIFVAGYKILLAANSEQSANKMNRNKLIWKLGLALDDAIIQETQELERRVAFLGTCGSVTPFIGLFGTVWGIMNAFLGIGMAGSASIAAVAPGIADSLIATAAGLVAAIPAVIAYNHFLGKIRTFQVVFEKCRTNFLASID